MNARRTLAKLLEWDVVPVINENDTTATDEISFGDNDILAAQVAILMSADLLVVLSDVDGLYTSDPSSDPGAQLVPEVHDLAELRAYEIGMSRSHIGSGGMRARCCARRWRPPPASRGDLQRDRAREPAAGGRAASRSARASTLRRGASRASSCGCGTRRAPRGTVLVDPGRRARAARAGHQPAAGRRGRGGGRLRGR